MNDMKPGTPPAPRADQRPERRLEQRIAKLLARAGVASRRDIERMIADGRVALNGEVLTTPATLLTSLHGVTVDGIAVKAAAPARLFRFHKPAGLLTTERDPAGRPTIYDRLPRDLPRLVPVGRLDLNTEGLLLLTTDGELKRQLELPSTGVTRIYRARTFGTVTQEQLEALIHGVEIEGIRYGSIDANLERRTGRNQWIELRLTEGKNREVRRVLEHLGLQVSRLIRTAYGPFPLADLPPGAVDEIRQHDLVHFRSNLRGGRALPEPQPLLHPSPLKGEGGTRPAQPGGRSGQEAPALRASLEGPRRGVRVRAASAAQSTRQTQQNAPHDPQTRSPTPAKLRPPAPRQPRPAREPTDRDSIHHRPARTPKPGAPGSRPAKPAPRAPGPNKDAKPDRPKRGAGWAKAKPPPNARPSSRSTRRDTAKPGPTRDRPGGNKK